MKQDREGNLMKWIGLGTWIFRVYVCLCLCICMCIDRTKEEKDREREKAENKSLPGNLRIDKVT